MLVKCHQVQIQNYHRSVITNLCLQLFFVLDKTYLGFYEAVISFKITLSYFKVQRPQLTYYQGQGAFYV